MYLNCIIVVFAPVCCKWEARNVLLCICIVFLLYLLLFVANGKCKMNESACRKSGLTNHLSSRRRMAHFFKYFYFYLYRICLYSVRFLFVYSICICSLTNHLSSQRRVAHFSKLFQSLVVQCLNNCCIVVFHFVLYLWCGKPSIKVAKNGGLLFCTISCLVIVVVVVLL